MSCFLWLRSYRRLAIRALLSIFVFFWVMSLGVTTRFIGVSLENEWEVEGKAHGDISGLPNADAIVVLGGGMGVHKKCNAPEIAGGADRVWQGAKLYKAGLAQKVFCTGGGVEGATVPFLVDLGVPRGNIFFDESPRNTEEEAKLIYTKLSQADGVTPKILLVTSAWHMTRAKLLFEKVGFDVVPAPTDFEMSYILELPLTVGDFFPWPDSLIRNSCALKEWVANVGYRLLKK